MVALTEYLINDPTLEAMERAIEQRAAQNPRRGYLGMSSIGRECSRELWYGFRWVHKVTAPYRAQTRFEDGFAVEDLMAKRLRMVPGLTLMTEDPETGKQFGFSDHGGHFRGHMDGAIVGLIQAPSVWHVWEQKATNEKKYADFIKIKVANGEKETLKKWDLTYYAQHVLYMHYGEFERGYITVSTPGGRDTHSARTNSDLPEALRLIEKAKRIIFATQPLSKISEDAAWFGCRWCDHKNICHGGEMPDRNCRTCLHSTPERKGGWTCAKHNRGLTTEQQEEGCAYQRFIPALVPGTQIDAAADATWISYAMRDGTTWKDEGQK